MEQIEKLIAVQQKLNAPKDKVNKFGGYSYRSCEGILEAVKPLLKEQELALVISDEIFPAGQRIYVKATAKVIDKSGAVVAESTAYAREEEDKKGMDAAQLTGATSSYARKYALNGLFAIDDNKDADTEEYQENRNSSESKQKTPTKPTTQPKAEKPSEAKESGKDNAKKYDENYYNLLSDISCADSVAAVQASVALVLGQEYELEIRRAAAKKGIELAKTPKEMSDAYALIQGREGSDELRQYAIEQGEKKGFPKK